MFHDIIVLKVYRTSALKPREWRIATGVRSGVGVGINSTERLYTWKHMMRMHASALRMHSIWQIWKIFHLQCFSENSYCTELHLLSKTMNSPYNVSSLPCSRIEFKWDKFYSAWILSYVRSGCSGAYQGWYKANIDYSELLLYSTLLKVHMSTQCAWYNEIIKNGYKPFWDTTCNI